jgi:hypothetical protein
MRRVCSMHEPKCMTRFCCQAIAFESLERPTLVEPFTVGCGREAECQVWAHKRKKGLRSHGFKKKNENPIRILPFNSLMTRIHNTKGSDPPIVPSNGMTATVCISLEERRLTLKHPRGPEGTVCQALGPNTTDTRRVSHDRQRS